VFKRLHQARRGVRGGCRGAEPPMRGFGGSALEKKKIPADIFPMGRHISGTTYFRDHMILGGFSAHSFLLMVFYFRLRN
jgi:hypothetical protein